MLVLLLGSDMSPDELVRSALLTPLISFAEQEITFVC